METKVSISNDITVIMLMSPLMSMHPYAPAPPAPPVPPPSPIGTAIEIPIPIFWPTGFVMGKNKLTDTVKHRGLSIALEGHDCGPGIMHIHVAPAPNNLLNALQILSSKRKANFSSGEIKADGTPIANCRLIDLPPTPMTSCGSPISVPGTGTPSAALNSLIVGVHPVDLVAGWVQLALTFLGECATAGAAGDAGPTPAGSTDGEVVFNEFARWGQGIGNSPSTPIGGGESSITSSGPGIWAGLIRLAGQEFFGYGGDASMAFNLRQGPFTLGASLTRAGDTHDWTGASTQGVGGPLGISGGSVEERVRILDDGGVDGRVRAKGNFLGHEGRGDVSSAGGRPELDGDFDWAEL